MNPPKAMSRQATRKIKRRTIIKGFRKNKLLEDVCSIRKSGCIFKIIFGTH
jgi:hypothetical protein